MSDLLNVDGKLINIERAEKIKPMHARVIDEYINNGGNKSKAFKRYNPLTNVSGAITQFNVIMASDEGIAYYNQRIKEIQDAAKIKPVDVLNTFKTWLYADITDYIGLTKDELKELPPEVRQCIQSADIEEKEYTQRDGTHIKQTNIKLKLTDKHKAAEAISKHIGFYLEDNKQKANKIDIGSLNVNVLNALLDASKLKK